MKNSSISHGDGKRILVIGAGIAGLTLAALLKQRGFKPVIIEKASRETFNTSGYMIGLMPLGGRVLNSLGLHDAYLENSLPISGYSLLNMKGRRLNHFGMNAISKLGTYQGISRPSLIRLLLGACDEPRFGATVHHIAAGSSSSTVTFSDESQEEFDLVVVADGIHSPTRELVFGSKNHTYRQTGWGGWAWFQENSPELGDTYREYWGADVFMGLYPVEGNRVGVFLGGTIRDIKQEGIDALIDKVKGDLTNCDLDLDALLRPGTEPFFWDFHDCRSESWRRGTVVLLGDAATGFLPTAGVGASMAMDSASVLADEISRSDPENYPYALKLYEQRQRSRVEMAQKTSRRLGDVMFVKNPVLAGLRNQLVRVVRVRSFLKGIRKLIEG